MVNWSGVFPAITTPFKADLSIDFDALEAHVDWMIESGCRGIVPLGSLGEANTLSFDEKVAIIDRCKRAIDGRVPLIVGIAALSTAEAVQLASQARDRGADGLMVLPPYVYRGDARETAAHFDAVIASTNLSCMLYNNPVAYGTDVLPAQLAELAKRHANLHAVKESSTDVRRVTEIRERIDDRLAIFVGVDDLILEGIAAGAVGWIAGLVNAFPRESVELYELALASDSRARRLYEWFLPLLRLDTVPKFVQLIKLVQAEAGRGSELVRPPRLVLEGTEREDALRLIRASIAKRAAVAS